MKVFYSLLCIILFLALAVFSLSCGNIYISLPDTLRHLAEILCASPIEDIHKDMIQYIRIPHILLAFFVGVGLSAAGTVMQAVVKNPLADPYLLGISSGASFGAVLSIISGTAGLFGPHGAGIFAFLGAVSTSALILLLSSFINKKGTLTLILAGFAINAVCSAFVSLMILVAADTRQTHSIQFWLMGNMSANHMASILVLSLTITLCTLFFICQYRILDLMLIGDELSLTMGRNLSIYRRRYITIIALMVGGIVYMTGIIGFVGLLVPHATRRFIKGGHRKLLPAAATGGGFFLAWTDIIGRSILPGIELPIGVSTAVLGAPLFLWLLLSGKQGPRP